MMCWSVMAWTAAVLLASFIGIAGCERLEDSLHPDRCALSGRPIPPGTRTGVETGGDKIPRDACCLRCVLSHANQMRTTARVLWATDYVSHERIDPDDASYVVGSRVSHCSGAAVAVPETRRETWWQSFDRCLPSVLAFAERGQAERFSLEYGGVIQTFEALKAGADVTGPRSEAVSEELGTRQRRDG